MLLFTEGITLGKSIVITSISINLIFRIKDKMFALFILCQENGMPFIATCVGGGNDHTWVTLSLIHI